MGTFTQVVLLAVLIMVSAGNQAFAQEGDPQVAFIARDIQKAIESKDIGFFEGHMPDELYFVDDPYGKQELMGLFKDDGSWLQRNLFEGGESVRDYLRNAKELQIKIFKNDFEYIISFRSANHPSHEWPWCSVVLDNGGWYFGDMFSYR